MLHTSNIIARVQPELYLRSTIFKKPAIENVRASMNAYVLFEIGIYMNDALWIVTTEGNNL